jgi:hypothetical protein
MVSYYLRLCYFRVRSRLREISCLFRHHTWSAWVHDKAFGRHQIRACERCGKVELREYMSLVRRNDGD